MEVEKEQVVVMAMVVVPWPWQPRREGARKEVEQVMVVGERVRATRRHVVRTVVRTVERRVERRAVFRWRCR